MDVLICFEYALNTVKRFIREFVQGKFTGNPATMRQAPRLPALGKSSSETWRVEGALKPNPSLDVPDVINCLLLRGFLVQLFDFCLDCFAERVIVLWQLG